MKVLVVDSNKDNLDSAKLTLIGHDLTVTHSLNGAIECMKTAPQPFEAVLTELMLKHRKPEFAYGQRDDDGQLIAPHGFMVGFMAGLYGARFVGIVTNDPDNFAMKNQHMVNTDLRTHMSAAFSTFHSYDSWEHTSYLPDLGKRDRHSICRKSPDLMFNGARVTLTHTPFLFETDGSKVTCPRCHGTRVGGSDQLFRSYGPCIDCDDNGMVKKIIRRDRKDWAVILKRTVEDGVSE